MGTGNEAHRLLEVATELGGVPRLPRVIARRHDAAGESGAGPLEARDVVPLPTLE